MSWRRAQASHRESSAWAPPARAASTRRATSALWRRSWPGWRAHRAYSPGSSTASTQARSAALGPPGRSAPKNRPGQVPPSLPLH